MQSTSLPQQKPFWKIGNIIMIQKLTRGHKCPELEVLTL